MTRDEIEVLRELEAAIPAGPWSVRQGSCLVVEGIDPHWVEGLSECETWPEDPHVDRFAPVARFIAAVRNAAPALLRGLDEQAAEIVALREYVRNCRDNFDCDADAHRYGTFCRACEAAKVLGPKP